MTVTDDDGAKATDSVIVTLTNMLPTANAGVDQTAVSGATVTLDGSASKDLEGAVSLQLGAEQWLGGDVKRCNGGQSHLCCGVR